MPSTRMPRLTLKFLVKGFVVVIVLLFMLPVLLNRLDSAESQSQKKRAIIKKDLSLGKHSNNDEDSDVLKFKPAEQQIHRPKEQGPLGRLAMRQEGEEGEMGAGENGDVDHFAPKVYGPKTVFKDGVLGNYEPTDYHAKGSPGDGGQPVYTSMAEKTAADRSVREFGFNMVASDKITMDRTIPDTRMDECKYWQYPEKMPSASVIIVFHNEGWSTLMRTVHSVIDMSPPHLLHEVVMVDDFSEKRKKYRLRLCG